MNITKQKKTYKQNQLMVTSGYRDSGKVQDRFLRLMCTNFQSEC